jgi:hypothetical protein
MNFAAAYLSSARHPTNGLAFIYAFAVQTELQAKTLLAVKVQDLQNPVCRRAGRPRLLKYSATGPAAQQENY